MDGVIHTEIFWGFLAGGSVLPKYWRHLPIFIPCLSNNDFSRFQYIEFITLDISLDSIVKKWVKFWAKAPFGVPPTPKKAGKLKTAISRPFLVQMSWFFAWDFVITYSVRKISHQPPDQPPVRAATRPTAFRQKLSNPADIRRDGYQAYNSASYEILAQTKPKWLTDSPPKWIYCVLGPISRMFELC